MPLQTGIWTKEEAVDDNHIFDYKLAQWMGQYFDKKHPLIDLGCGPGTYLRYFHDVGFEHLKGIEGTELNFEIGVVKVADLTRPFTLEKKGNIICLEVAEHIPEEFMDKFLHNVVNHLDGTLILSWAIPGQGGLGHVNCRHNIWVIDEMQKRGLVFNLQDSLKARAMVSNHARWFRDTLLVFQKITYVDI
jgi:hypothetical protein